MDVVNGKIVSAKTERSELWIGVKRSFGSTENGSSPRSDSESHQLPSSSRAKLNESGGWGSTWGNPGRGKSLHCGEVNYSSSMSSVSMFSSAVRHSAQPSSMASMGISSGTARWGCSRASLTEPASFAAPRAAAFQNHAATDGPTTMQTMTPCASGASLRPPRIESWRAGKSSLSTCGCSTEGLRHALAAGSGKETVSSGDCRGHRVCADTTLDQEMNMYESEIVRDVNRYFSRLPLTAAAAVPLAPSPQEAPPQGTPGSAVDIPHMDSSSDSAHVSAHKPRTTSSESKASEVMAKFAPPSPDSSALCANFGLKCNSSKSPGDDHKARTWVEPLRYLFRKALSVSDVGELGRVIISKKDAEGQLPRIEMKEVKLMRIEDYDIMRHWVFRYKCWLNNKSRMYVLENTGEFVRFHDLKERDALTFFADGVGELVVRGEKNASRDVAQAEQDDYSCTSSTIERQLSDGFSSHLAGPSNPVGATASETSTCRE